MRIKALYVIILLALAAGCAPLERPGVPVWYGLRLDAYLHLEATAQDLDRVRSQGGAGVIVELILKADSTSSLPHISRTSLTQLSRLLPLLQQKQTKYCLVVNHNMNEPLFSKRHDFVDAIWFQAYRNELASELLPRLRIQMPERLCLGVDFKPAQRSSQEWGLLVNSFRDSLPNTKLLYSATLEEAPTLELWQVFDEIGLLYETSTLQNDKSYAQEWNPKIGATAKKYNKPIFITHCNAINADKELQLKNRLRFWPKDAQLSGVTINNIFPFTVLSDTLSSYFGISREEELKSYLKTYAIHK